MTFKAIFKDSSFLFQILMLICLVLLGMFVLTVLFDLILWIKGGFSTKLFVDSLAVFQSAEMIRIVMFFQSICLFFLPAILAAYLFGDNVSAYLHTKVQMKSQVILLVVVSMVVLLPFLNFVLQLNESLKLPGSLKAVEDWMMKMEEDRQQMNEIMLYAPNISVLIFNLIVVGVIVSVGEEFIFRGVLQNIFHKIIRNEHLIIWVVAIIFSAVHFQFYGFIPRVLLGAYLGYLLYYTQSIWAPVLAHFINNVLGVLTYYIFQNSDQQIDRIENFGTGSGWWWALISLLLWSLIFIQIKKTCRER